MVFTTHPHLAPRLKKEYSYTYTPTLGLCDLFSGELYSYLYFVLFQMGLASEEMLGHSPLSRCHIMSAKITKPVISVAVISCEVGRPSMCS